MTSDFYRIPCSRGGFCIGKKTGVCNRSFVNEFGVLQIIDKKLTTMELLSSPLGAAVLGIGLLIVAALIAVVGYMTQVDKKSAVHQDAINERNKWSYENQRYSGNPRPFKFEVRQEGVELIRCWS